MFQVVCHCHVSGCLPLSCFMLSVTACFRLSVTACFMLSVTACFRLSVTACFMLSVTACFRLSVTGMAVPHSVHTGAVLPGMGDARAGGHLAGDSDRSHVDGARYVVYADSDL